MVFDATQNLHVISDRNDGKIRIIEHTCMTIFSNIL
jgi:hypothetical protein